jgi:hypothetical protein
MFELHTFPSCDIAVGMFFSSKQMAKPISESTVVVHPRRKFLAVLYNRSSHDLRIGLEAVEGAIGHLPGCKDSLQHVDCLKAARDALGISWAEFIDFRLRYVDDTAGADNSGPWSNGGRPARAGQCRDTESKRGRHKFET